MKNFLEIPVEEYASPILSFATEDMEVEKMIDQLEVNGFRHLPVLSQGKPVGMISSRDLSLIKELNRHFDLRAEDIMVADPYCVPFGTPIGDVAFEMSERKIGSAIVVDENGNADSIFTSVDALNALVEIVRGDFDTKSQPQTQAQM